MARGRFPRRLLHGEEATLVEHLGELRARLLISLVALGAGFIVCFAFHSQLIEWLLVPLPEDKQVVTLGVTEPFFTAVKVSLYGGFALALPVILYQLWSFLAPAIDEGMQRAIAVFVVIATVLFAVGLAFAYYIVLPKAISFLTNFDDDLYTITIRASYYLSFAALALVGTALLFEMPIFILALVRLRVLTSDRLRRNRRIGIFIVAIAAALLPTVDPVSLAIEIVPLVILFELSIWLAVLMERRWERSAEELASHST